MQVICSVTLTLNSISVMFTGVGYIGGSLSDVITQTTSGVVSEAGGSTKKLYIVGGQGGYYAIAHPTCSDQADTFSSHFHSKGWQPMYANIPICTSATSGIIANVMRRAPLRRLGALLLAGHGIDTTGGTDDGCVLCVTGDPTTMTTASKHTLIVSTTDYFNRHYVPPAGPVEDCCILDQLPQNCLQGVALVIVTGCGIGNPDFGASPPYSIGTILKNWLGAQCVVCAGENDVHDLQLVAWLNGADSKPGFLDEIFINGITFSDALSACRDTSDGLGDALGHWGMMASHIL